ncbi:MAG: NADH-quinone oxidoreductase subunit N [Thermoplasmata archaeon]|nr:NADH-quinone oxidoreductase subunit N [Thermoplasmata archaeon]
MDPVSWTWFLPEAFLLGAALLVFLLDVLGVEKLEAFGAVAVGATALSLLAVVADLGFTPLSFLSTLPPSVVDSGGGATSLYAFSSLGLVFQGVFLSSALLVSLASLSRPSHEKGAAVFYGLLLMATLGMMLVAVSADLIFLLLAIEVTGIATYLMVGYTRKDARGLEAAMKFYIIGALSTALSFFGASLLFGAFGSTNLLVLSQGLGGISNHSLALVGYAFLIVGLGFKVTLVPFHAWAVDVYDGAPTDVSAFLAGGTKKMGVFAFFLVFIGPLSILTVRAVNCTGTVCIAPYDFRPTVELTLGLLAIVTMTLGNVLALLQKEMKRMLAYSSISQAGYMMIGIAIGTAPALAGATLQILAHVFMKAGAFLVVAGVSALGVGPLIAQYRGLGQRRPYLGVAFALMLLSLAGIPLTVGFVSKFILFSAAVQASTVAGQSFFFWLAVAGLLNSALSVFYYARVLKVMYMESPDASVPLDGPAGDPTGGLGYGRSAAILLAVVAIVALGVYPQPVFSAIQAAATHFVASGA